MAAFPDGNPGVYPLDPGTPVGQFRLLYGDTESTAYVPIEPGFQDYGELSDSEVNAFLAQGAGSIPRAVGYYYLALSGRAAIASRQIQDADLKVDTTKRAADLRAIADVWFGAADNDDLVNAEEAFEIVPTGRHNGGIVPKGSPATWRRVYGIGRVC